MKRRSALATGLLFGALPVLAISTLSYAAYRFDRGGGRLSGPMSNDVASVDPSALGDPIHGFIVSAPPQRPRVCTEARVLFQVPPHSGAPPDYYIDRMCDHEMGIVCYRTVGEKGTPAIFCLSQ